MSTVAREKGQHDRKVGPENWGRWSAHLAKRRKPADPWRHIPVGGSWPLAWALNQVVAPDDFRQLLSSLQRWGAGPSKARTLQIVAALEDWLAAGTLRRREPTFGLECLAWTYALPRLAGTLPAAPWCEVLDFLTEAATALPDLSLDGAPLTHQWLAGELPLTLAYQFPELPNCSRLGSAAGEALSAGVTTLLDGNGLPAAEHLNLVRPLLACWTRCLTLARAADLPCWDETGSTHFEWFVRRALQLTRETGTPVFSNAAFTADDRLLFAAALQLAQDEEDAAVADQILPSRADQRRKSRRQVLFPDPAVNSEWGQVAILRPSWLRGGQQLVIAHHDGCLRTELNCGQETVWSGEWGVDVSIDGQRLAPPSGWDEVCWHSDDDVDYQELEAHLGDQWVVQRQILFSREDRFLFLADAVLGPHAAQIAYRTALPLAPRVRYQPAEETWEGQLTGRRRLGLVLPLALPEWRAGRRCGALESVDGQLQLSQTARAARLYAPWFIDLDRQRPKRQFTWRPLTVAEKLEIQPPTRAVAYRVQVDQDQWLFYRSLVEAANRSVLGQNLSNEFLAARFGRDGDTEDLIRIDAE